MSQLLPNLEGLPYELIFDILLKSNDLKTIASYCQTNKWASAVCEDEDFWKSMYYQNYGRSVLLLKGESWKDLFKDRMGQKVQVSPIVAWWYNYGAIDNLGKFYHTLSLDDIYARPPWGQRGKINFEIGSARGDLLRPINIPLEQKIISFSTSWTTTAVITDQGLVYLWGINIHKKLYYVRKLIEFPVKALKVSTTMYSIRGPGYSQVATVGIIGEDNYVYIWYGGKSPKIEKIPIKAVDLYLGENRSALIDLKGKLYLWGSFQTLRMSSKETGQFFIRKQINQPTPFDLGIPIKQIAIFSDNVVTTRPTMVFLSYDGIPYTLHGIVTLENDKFIPIYSKPYTKHPRYLITRLSSHLPDDGTPIRFIAASDGTVAMIGENRKLYIFKLETDVESAKYENSRDKHSRSIRKLLQGKRGLPTSETMGKRIFYPTGTIFQDDTIKRIEVDIGSPVRYVSVGNNFIVAVTDDGVVNIFEGQGL